MRNELRIKDGVRLRRAHYLPHMVRIILIALDTSPKTTDHSVWLTEAWRKIRDSLDFHELCSAFDFRCRNIVAETRDELELIAHRWAREMSERLGEDYDVIAHGEGDSFHIHAEYDPR